MPKRYKRKNRQEQPAPAKASKGNLTDLSKTITDWILGLILVLAVFVVYSPVWWAGFIWDDDKYITANPILIGPLGFMGIWSLQATDSCPVTMTTWWLEHALWGLSPLPYHIVNVLLQAACGITLWRVLLRLRVPMAWLGGTLWTLHPLQVESVAWISEMKNTESGLFFLLSIYCFLRWLRRENSQVKERGNQFYAATLVFAALAMGSKSSTVILPLVLALAAWWMEGRWQPRILMKLAPIFLMSVVTSALAIWAFQHQVNTDPLASRTFSERLIDAGGSFWFYLSLLVLPYPLITIYPRWDMSAAHWTSWLSSGAAIVVMGYLWLRRTTDLRPLFFTLAYFVIALLPVLGIVGQSFEHYSVVGDHLQYLAGMGPLALLGAGLAWFADWAMPGKKWLQGAWCAGLLLILGTVSWYQAWKYESQLTLWADTVKWNPGSFAALTNLGNALIQAGRPDEARGVYFKALKVNDSSALGYSNFGGALLLTGQLNDAIVSYQKALSLEPMRTQTEADLAFALNLKGQVDEAVAHYKKSLEIDPKNADAHFNLGTIYMHRGKMKEATAEYQAALTIRPGYAEAHYNYGTLLLGEGQVDEAINEYQSAINARPNYPEAHNNLGAAFIHKGRVQDAVNEFQQAVNLKPDFADARKNLGLGEQALQQKNGQGK